MNFFQNLWSDLVEKRLWPVAALLVAGLVAVPIVLGRSKEPETPPPAASLATNADIASPAKVKLADSRAMPEFIQREGKRRDPFRRTAKKVPKQAAQVAASVGATVGKALGGGTGTTTAPKVVVPPTRTYNVSLRFGQTGALKTFADVARLTPLPSDDNPMFVYLGLSDGKTGKRASFLISTEAETSGDGICQPSKSQCERVTLEAGETQFFDVPSGTGGITQYELRVVAISSQSGTHKSAKASYARESAAGRKALRNVLELNPKMLDGLGYSAQTGLLTGIR